MKYILILGCLILTGCEFKESESSPEMKRLERSCQYLNEQCAAATSQLNAYTMEDECKKRGDTDGAAYWHSNATVFYQMEKAAYEKLKNN